MVPVAIVLTVSLVACQPQPPVNAPTLTPEPPSAVTAKATIQPRQQAHLSFRMLGQVVLLPKVGDRVTPGQELARLDPSDLDLAIAQAQDSLAMSQAALDQAQAPARPEEIAAAQAAYDAVVAKQSLLQVGATAADLDAAKSAIGSAEAGVKAAQARLTQVKAGPLAADLAAAGAAVSQAKAALAAAQQLQDALDPASQAHQASVKQAKLALEAAKNTLFSTQTDRDATKGLYGADSGQGKAADGRVAAAETAVSQAQAALDELQKPPTDSDRRAAAEALAAAQSSYAAAQSRLDQIRSGSTAADVATATSGVSTAESAVAAAQAHLDSLQRGASDDDKRAAAAAVAQAKAALDLRKAGPTSTELAVYQARVKQAQTALEQAKSARRAATILAPLAGTVVDVGPSIGDTVQPGTPVVTVADPSSLIVETSDLDEAGAALLQVDMPVKVQVNAFANKVLPGKIEAISPLATTTANGDANYTVRVALTDLDPALRLGMTAHVEFPVTR
jgi:multidrug efflux pump subunit AcrA (membrane-fusion protein)